jgi:hypothetical protein
LSGPGVQFIADNQLYNSIITAHAIIMIFFMVKKYSILNSHITFFKKVNSADNNSLLLNECYNNNGSHKPENENNNPHKENNNPHNKENNNPHNKENDGKKHNYVKVLVDTPYENRDIILKVTKKQKGVYI